LFDTADGRTHASNVIADVRSSDAASGTVTLADVPLNDNAAPNFPDADQVALPTDPSLPFPDASATVVPDPSLNENAATNPGDAALIVSAPQSSTNADARTRGTTSRRGTDGRGRLAAALTFELWSARHICRNLPQHKRLTAPTRYVKRTRRPGRTRPGGPMRSVQ
jgi:hypothetical protein